MRVSSATAPSCIGTLRSSRTTTRLPRKLPAWGSVTKRIARAALRHGGGKLGENHLRHVGQTARVAPFVVVPRRDLHQVADDVGQRTVDDRTVLRALEVARDQ